MSLEVKHLTHTYSAGSAFQATAVHDVSLTIEDGEFVCIVGHTGSGKSTLLNQLAGLEKPTRGVVRIGGVPISQLNENQLAAFRQKHIGFVFQSYNLLPELTAAENVAMPLMFKGIDPDVRLLEAKKMLCRVGLKDRMDHFPNQMSGGQMQRVAIARALVNNPAVILADEATGNLDTRTSFEILVLFQKLHAEGRTIIFVTHNPEIAQYSSRNIVLRDGQVKDDKPNRNILNAAETLAALPKQEDD